MSAYDLESIMGIALIALAALVSVAAAVHIARGGRL